jgi:hypothetical protein
MDEDMITDNTLSKKQMAMSNGTKSIMRPSRKSAEEHSKSRAKMLAVANAASKNDDPYYCGLRARVPNFVNGKQHNPKESKVTSSGNKSNSKVKSALSPPPSRSTPNLQNLAQLPGAAPPFWWHSRLYPDSGIGASSPSTVSGQSGFPPPHMAYRVNELPNYHYPGRMGNRGYGNVKQSASMFQPQPQPQAVLATGTTTLHSHRPAIFRTGWE